MTNLPIVSCLMPTGGRRELVALSIACFRAQTYPARELIIVDDGHDQVADLCDGPSVRHMRVAPQTTIGEKRNLAMEVARGAIFMQWDDDDWYGRERIALQAVPLIRGDFDMTGLVPRLVLEAPRERLWRMTDALCRRIFPSGLHSGTLTFTRALVERGARYPDSSTGEDVSLVKQSRSMGARIGCVEHDDAFVYVRHSANAWASYQPGAMEPDGWLLAPRPECLSAELVQRYGEAARRLVPVQSMPAKVAG
jgi:glycosyltransferase involved in cell wall biosynthesis